MEKHILQGACGCISDSSEVEEDYSSASWHGLHMTQQGVLQVDSITCANDSTEANAMNGRQALVQQASRLCDV